MKAGVNPDHQDNDGFTALHYAVEFANLQLTDIFVSKGDRIDVKPTGSKLHFTAVKKITHLYFKKFEGCIRP
jgi:ankyrin repeat protein